MDYTIGVDLGGTNIAIGLVDNSYELKDQLTIPTQSERPWHKIVNDIMAGISKLLDKNKVDILDCTSFGIGCPGTCDTTNGVVLYSNNIKWHNVPIAAELQKLFGVSCFISNDANCAALGEAIAGAAKGCKNVVMLTLGTGVGGGVIVDGKLYEGVNGAGAELGHCNLISGGVPCTCGRLGCIESYASATALVEQGKKAAMEHPESSLNTIEWNAKNIFEESHKGDKTACEVIEQYKYYLGEAVCNMVNIFRPEMILIGGGISGEGDSLIEPLNDYVKKNCFGGDISYVTKVSAAELGNKAGIIGAAALCRRRDSFIRQPLLLKPAFKDYLWGGEYLKEHFGKKTDCSPLAESWELSCHPDGESIILTAPFEGVKLSKFLSLSPNALSTSCKFDTLPILIKLIDAKDNLSVQVHPDDYYARTMEHDSGKTEMWYIVDCVPGSILYYGLKHSVSKEEFARRIEDETLTEILNAVEVKPGDVFFIEAGTIHAIGKGIVIAEIQQNSNITYRVYDYGRRDSLGNTRPLHIEKALEVSSLTFPEYPIGPKCAPVVIGNCIKTLLTSNEYFTTILWDIASIVDFEVQYDSFHSLLCINGTAALIFKDKALPLRKGDSYFLPADMGKYKIVGTAKILLTTL